MQPQSTLSKRAREGGEGVGGDEAMGRDGREAQLDVQREGLRQPTTCAAARPLVWNGRSGGGRWSVGTRGIKKC